MVHRLYVLLDGCLHSLYCPKKLSWSCKKVGARVLKNVLRVEIPRSSRKEKFHPRIERMN